MKAEVGIGVIGVGRMGQVHAEAVARQTGNVRLIGVADARGEIARRTAEKLGARMSCDNPAELLARPDIQGVIIATPSHTHMELIRAAAAAGKDILCEKPLALTMADTGEAIRLCRERGVRLQVGFMRRFDAGVRAAREAIRDGSIGRPVMYKALQRDESAPPAGFCDPRRSGGMILDMGIHEIDSGRWLLDQEAVEVWAIPGPIVEAHVGEAGDLDNICIQLRYAGGAVGQIDLSRNARYGDDVRFEIVGSEASVFWGELPRQQLAIGRRGRLEHPTVNSFVDRFFPAWIGQIAAFAEAIAYDRAPEVTGEDAGIALRTALAATQSLATGAPVRVEEER